MRDQCKSIKGAEISELIGSNYRNMERYTRYTGFRYLAIRFCRGGAEGVGGRQGRRISTHRSAESKVI